MFLRLAARCESSCHPKTWQVRDGMKHGMKSWHEIMACFPGKTGHGGNMACFMACLWHVFGKHGMFCPKTWHGISKTWHVSEKNMPWHEMKTCHVWGVNDGLFWVARGAKEKPTWHGWLTGWQPASQPCQVGRVPFAFLPLPDRTPLPGSPRPPPSTKRQPDVTWVY